MLTYLRAKNKWQRWRSYYSPVNLFFCAAGGQRRVKMSERFFVGYRRTLIEPSEILLYVDIPHTTEVNIFASRRSMIEICHHFFRRRVPFLSSCRVGRAVAAYTARCHAKTILPTANVSCAVVKLPSHRWGIPKFETTRLYVCQTRGKVSNKHKAFHPTVH